MLIEISFYRKKIRRKRTKIKDTKETIRKNELEIMKFIRDLKNPQVDKVKTQIDKNIGPPPEESEEIPPTNKFVPDDDLKSIYKECSKKLHPDKIGNTEDATQTFQEFQEAYTSNNAERMFEIIEENNIDIPVDKKIKKMFKNQYINLKKEYSDLKSMWQLQWNPNATKEEKLAFVQKLEVV